MPLDGIDDKVLARSLRVAVVATSEDRQRALVAHVTAAGHRVVESEAQLVLVDSAADAGAIDDALRRAGDLIDSAPEPLADVPGPGGGFRAAGEASTAPLTPRESEILSALGEGMSNKEVARALGISAHTVKFHLETIFRKLEVTSRAEAVAKGLRRGIIEL
jgi:DNA-binding NarL/FixJ family response regulator